MKYKDLHSKVHVIEPEFAYMLPEGSVHITDAEAEALRPVSPPPTALDQIRAIENKPDVADAFVRATRQLLLSTWFQRIKAKPAAASMTDEQIEAYCRANDPTYKTLAETEDAIKPLRSKL